MSAVPTGKSRSTDSSEPPDKTLPFTAHGQNVNPHDAVFVLATGNSPRLWSVSHTKSSRDNPPPPPLNSRRSLGWTAGAALGQVPLITDRDPRPRELASGAKGTRCGCTECGSIDRRQSEGTRDGGGFLPSVQPTLLMSMVSRASCRRRSLRSRLLSEEEATPPLPVLPPGRCWKSMMLALGLY